MAEHEGSITEVSGDALEREAATVARSGPESPPSCIRTSQGDEREPRSIGPYQLIEKLGEGGMGQVWLAEQTAPLRRQVALKLIRVGIYDTALLQRFQYERQSLAMMNHPAIASIFDAGATPEGQPYFVMEYVPGKPITDYCNETKLRIRERLELFLAVCDGVQHAHQKAIIHRDLKPANILVADVDGRATPRVIDFGLAKATVQVEAGETLFTQIGSFVGTPGYMSPEQADPGAQDVDTRTDVYSLGVILYVLLTGIFPFDPKEWQKLPLLEVLRQLREDDPPKPSAQLNRKATTEPEAAIAAAAMRQTTPKQLTSLLRGDLDCITMKALEKDRARRYGTPSELAADLERYLNHVPVMARPASVGYRLARFAARNRWGIAGGAAIAISLAAGTVVSLSQASIAKQRFQQVRKLAGRFIELHDDVARLPGSTSVREKMVATALDYLDNLSRSAGRDPELLHEIGEAYAKVANAQGAPGQPNLGRTEDALASYRKAIEFDRRASRLNPAYRPSVADAESTLAYMAMLSGHLPEARSNLEAAAMLLGQLRAEKPQDPDVLLLAARVALHQGDLQEYEGHSRDQLPFWEQSRQFTAEYARIKQDDASRFRLHFITDLVATALGENQRYGEAVAVLRQGEPLIDSLLAAEPDNPAYLRAKMSEANYLGQVYDDESGGLNKPAEAVAADRRYVALAERLAAADPNNASARLSMAVAYYRLSYPLRETNAAEALVFARKGVRVLDVELLRAPKDRLLRSRRARALRYLAYALESNHERSKARQVATEAAAVQRQLLKEMPSDSSERDQVALTEKVLARLS